MPPKRANSTRRGKEAADDPIPGCPKEVSPNTAANPVGHPKAASRFNITKIQDGHKIVVPNIPKPPNPKTIGAYNMFPDPYSNVLLLARKKSGKSTVVYNILKECCGPDTKVFIFSSTVFRDPTYIEAMKMLRDRGIEFVAKMSFLEEPTRGKKGVNHLSDIMEAYGSEKKDNTDQDVFKMACLGAPLPERPTPAKKKTSKIWPEILVICDDLGSLCRHASLTQYLKTNRHSRSKIIVSFQGPNDAVPAGKRQFDTIILFRGLAYDKLVDMYEFLDPGIPLEDFIDLYNMATLEQYSFLYWDVPSNTFRINFDEKIEIA